MIIEIPRVNSRTADCTAGKPAEEIGELSREFCRNESFFATVEMLTEQLENKLKPVLRPSTPTPEEQSAEKDPAPMTDYGHSLRAYGDRINDCGKRMRSILVRLEL